MKLLSHLEKNKYFWSLLGLCTLFFMLRLPSLIEPHWYGDEGIYQVIGQALHQGGLLYRDIWDNKPPLLYVLYALANGDQSTMRLLSLIAGLIAIPPFFILVGKLFHSFKISMIVTSIFVVLFGTPFLEGNIANAENFMLPLTISAGLLTYHISQKSGLKLQKQILFSAGLILGVAFLFKIVAVFDMAAFILFLFFVKTPHFSKQSLLVSVKKIAIFVLGFVIPFILSVGYFAAYGILIEYFQSAFSSNVEYVGFENYLFGIPQGLLLVKVLLLTFVTILLFIKRKSLSKATLFVLLWSTFTLFSANFSGRPYTHYVLMLLPSFCLFIGLALHLSSKRYRLTTSLGVIGISIFFCLTFPLYGLGKTFAYYQNSLLFLTNQRNVYDYQHFFDAKTPRDYTLASFIKSNTTNNDKVFIWGDSAQIYALSEKTPPYKYAVAYHVIQSPQLLLETQQALDTSLPKYIIVLPETQPLPFRVPLYIIRFNIEGAIIYERSI